MKLLLSLLGVAFAGLCLGQALDPAPAKEAMKKLAWLEGRWTGKGTMNRPGGPLPADMVETTAFKLDGLVMTVEGRGTNEGRVVHHAFGVISYDGVEKKYKLKAFLANGQSVDARIEVGDGKIEWGMDVGPGRTVRYVVHNKDGKWNEIGEFSPDSGKTWMKFMDMTLSKSN